MTLKEFKSKARKVEYPMGYKHVYKSVTSNEFVIATNISSLGIKHVAFFVDDNKVTREEFLSVIDDLDQFLKSVDEVVVDEDDLILKLQAKRDREDELALYSDDNGESWVEDGIQYSGCCSAVVLADTDICTDCGEHI